MISFERNVNIVIPIRLEDSDGEDVTGKVAADLTVKISNKDSADLEELTPATHYTLNELSEGEYSLTILAGVNDTFEHLRIKIEETDIATKQYCVWIGKEMALFQLLMRKDFAIGSDLSAVMDLINADRGSGGGTADNKAHSTEAIRDHGDQAWLTGGGIGATKDYTTTDWTRTVGDNDGGAGSDTTSVNGVLFETGEVNSGTYLEVDAQFTADVGDSIQSLDTWAVYIGGGNHYMEVLAKDNDSGLFEPVGVIDQGSIVQKYPIALSPNHINPSTGVVDIKYRHAGGSGTPSHVFGVDKAQINTAIPASTITVQEIVNGVWDEPNADHLDAGSTGAVLNDGFGSHTKIWPFTTAGNYTFDTDKLEITDAGIARLIGEDDATFGANFGTDIDGNWGAGVLTGAATGGAAVSAGKLDLAHNDTRYVSYDADANADSQQVGAIRFKFTPNYNGSPSTIQSIFCISKAAGDNDNLIQINHVGAGTLNVIIFDSTGAAIVNESFGAWSPTLGTEYEFELNWSLTDLGEGDGATRLFIDGAQFGSTNTATGTRDASIALFRLGTNTSAAFSSNFELDDVLVFDAVQHIATYVPDGRAVPDTQYPDDSPIMTPDNYQIPSLTDLSAFVVVEGGSNAGTLKFRVSDDSGTTYYYWDGDSWEESSGVGESNTAAEMNTNLPTFDPINGFIIFQVIFVSDGTQRTEIDSMTLGYKAGGPSAEDNAAAVWLHSSGLGVIGATSGKKVINAAGTQVEIYDSNDALFVTLDRTGTDPGPYTWTATKA